MVTRAFDMTRLRKAIAFEQAAVVISLVGVIAAGLMQNPWVFCGAIAIAMVLQFVFCALANCPFCGDWLFAGMKKNLNVWKAVFGAESIECVSCGTTITIDKTNVEQSHAEPTSKPARSAAPEEADA